MASYNIAANTKRISPVQEMLQARAQNDAHEINQLNIDRAEIEMPYVKQLTEQKVRANELSIEAAETNLGHLERSLQQQETQRDQAIKMQGNALEEQERVKAYQEAVASDTPPEALKKVWPDLYRKDRQSELEANVAAADAFEREFEIIQAQPTLEGREREMARAIANQPDEVKQMYAGIDLSDAGLARLRQAQNASQQTNITTLIDQIAIAKGEWERTGDPEDKAFYEMLRMQLQNIGSSRTGSGTRPERVAATNFPNSSNSMNDQAHYDTISERYQQAITDEIAQITGVPAKDWPLTKAFKWESIAQTLSAAGKTDEEIAEAHAEVSRKMEIIQRSADATIRDDPNYNWYAANKDALGSGRDGIGLSEWHTMDEKPKPDEITEKARTSQYSGDSAWNELSASVVETLSANDVTEEEWSGFDAKTRQRILDSIGD